MTELFDDEDDKVLVVEEELEDAEDIPDEDIDPPLSDARRRLEKMLEEKRLRDELEDFLD